MSSVHLARQGFITKATLPSVSRERGSTSVADNRTVLLLNGNGTNGKQNNTFVTDNFGTGGQGNYSVFFDGNGDTLDVATTTTFAAANEDFTLEFWLYKLTSGSFQMICGWTNNPFDYCTVESDNKLSLNMNNNYTVTTAANAITNNTWNHIAFTRSSNTVRIFVNGVQSGSNFTVSTSFGQANNLRIGNWKSSPNYFLNGYLSNFRFVKGTAVYTSAFTPPTSELTAISGTSLLTCQGTVIRDASSNNFAITVNGDAKVATNTSSAPIAITRNGNATQGSFSPFTLPDGQWSNFFDGTGDYLTTGSVNFGSGAFTAEGWFYATALPASGSQGMIFATPWGNSNNFQLYINNNSTISWQSFAQGGSGPFSTFSLNTWNHFAVVRNGSTCTLYLNGVAGQTATLTNNPSATVHIGSRAADNLFFTGYLSNIRIVPGTALYTSNFTPPTTPLTAISGTALLTCQSNRFKDNSSNNFAITRNGDVRVTPWSPFAPTSAYNPATNGGSGYFDGTGDYLSIADAAGLRFGTGNFTIQAWVFRSVAGAVHTISAKGGASTGWVFQVHSDNKLRFTHTTTNIDSTGIIAAGQWVHVAVVREGTGTNQVKLYINGVNDGQGTVSTDFTQTEQLNFGADRGNANPMNGYIAGLKYNVGTAETITVPTAPPSGGTALLNFTNAGIFDTAGDNVIETVGNAQIDTAVKKYGTGALEFDGNDYLIVPNSPDLIMGTGDFTFEGWVYSTVTQDRGVFHLTTSHFPGTTNNSIALGVSSAGKWQIYAKNINTVSTVGYSTNTWYYFAVVRSGTTTTLYIDGTSVITVSSDTTNYTGGFLGIGSIYSPPTSFGWNGYIDDFRITKGFARYTANFTPPTAEAIIFGTAPNIVNNSTYGVYQLA